jgi:hypothetical protein
VPSVSQRLNLRDVRVRWFRNLLDHAMPHASCASRAGSHGTPRLQAQRPAKSFDISLTLSLTSGSTCQPLLAKLEPADCPCPFAVAVWPECSARRDR